MEFSSVSDELRLILAQVDDREFWIDCDVVACANSFPESASGVISIFGKETVIHSMEIYL